MSQVAEPSDGEGRDRVLKLIDFLADCDALQHPPVRDVTSYGLYLLAQEDLPDSDGVLLTPGGEPWLSVEFVELPPLPAVPVGLEAYLPDPASITSSIAPVVRAPDDEWDFVGERPLHLDKVDRAQRWVDTVWASWAAEHRDASATKTFYRGLFEQSQLLADNRETFELLWGFGRLRWTTEDGTSINHPLFTIPVEIERSEDQTLTVSPSGALVLDTLPLAGAPVADRAALASKRRVVEDDPFDPWSLELAEQARTTVRLLHDLGTVSGEGQAQLLAPVVDTGWTLFVRRRRPDYQGYLDAMRDLYQAGTTPPDALRAVVIDAPSTLAVNDISSDGYTSQDLAGAPAALEPLLLPLASNEEQQRILELAQVQSGVVVQGPPGTGKSHTIANLISHYVAYGHRVLVVAEKEQALRVLAEKIPEQIRDLTVSVLGADRAGQSALESSIGVIQARVSGLDPAAQDRLIDSMTSELAGLDAAIAGATDRLMSTLRAEAETLPGAWPAGTNPTPSVAAAWVSAQQATLGYIPDLLPATQSSPLTASELAELVRLVSSIGIDRAQECAFTVPDLAALPDGPGLDHIFDLRTQLLTNLAPIEPFVDWFLLAKAADGAVEALTEGLTAARDAAQVAADSPWLSSLSVKIRDPLLAREWQSFADTVSTTRERILSLRPALAAHTVTVPATPDPLFIAHLTDARDRLAAKGKLGMFAGDAKKALDGCTVDGRAAVTLADVELCLAAADVERERRELRLRWNTQIDLVSGPQLPEQRPEEDLGELLAAVRSVLDASATWTRLHSAASQLGVTLPGSGTGSLEDLIMAVEISQRLPLRPALNGLEAQIRVFQTALQDGARAVDASSYWGRMLVALDTQNTQEWDALRMQVHDLTEVAPQARRLVELSERLSTRAPLWTQTILADPTSAGDPADLDRAWAWRVLDCWVSSIISGESPDSLQKTLEDLARRRRAHVAELVGIRAWRRLTDNLGDRQRQALNSYLAAVKRYGKTGGKFKARWLEAIRVALNESKDAVPVWIMPTSRALTSFRPDAQVPFDVIIIDEASQIEISALPLLSLARRAIVVGDDKQTTPSVIGLDQSRVFDLIDTHLTDIPHARTLFNVGNSLYDLAFQKFPRSVMLREHFRCLPEIISYSNRMFYDGRIEPLRDQRPSPNWPALGTVKVLDGYRTAGGTNVAEANATVDLVAEMVADPVYDGMDFGVICLLSGGQAELVKTGLFDRLGPQVISDRRIRVGDAANFQGDERDVMVVSLVAGTDPNNPTGRIGALTSLGDAQRINVAASRARHQMWVVHSLEPDRFPNGDPRAELIRHCRDPRSFDDAIEDQLARCDSDFERSVLSRIAARGYRRIRSQVHVGTENSSYRIDLVVEGPAARLAIECDGEAWHGPERWHADRARQVVLERAGWTFVRIRGSAYYRDPDVALEPLWERLDELGIPTGSDWLDTASAGHHRQVHGLPLGDAAFAH